MYASICTTKCNISSFIIIGTDDFIKKNPTVLKIEADKDTKCKKDTGEKEKLQMWSRGHFFIVRPCGHIDQWQPLYRYVDR